VNSPSDDPVAFGASMLLNTQMSSISNDGTLAQQIQGKLQSTEGALTSATNAINTAISIATQGADGSVNTSQMQSLGQEVGGLLNQVITAADFQYSGAYVFGGNQSLTAPYNSAGAYSGSTSTNTFTFANGGTVHLNFNGQAIFGDNTSGVIGALVSLQNALNAGDKAGTAAALSGLQTGLQQVAEANASIGTDLQTVSSVISNSNSQVTTIQSALNNIVNLDVPQAVATQQEQLLQEQALVSFASSLGKLPLVNVLA
jgi:flagellar hook-associated protein 3 FlgL